MNRRMLSFAALVVSILYGVGFAVIGDADRQTYAAVGGALVAIAWIAVGVLGRDDVR